MYKDLREFIDLVDRLGALRHIDGADPRFEIGGITEVAAGRPDCPALLFDNIKGYRHGMRVFTNATTNVQRAALALGLDPGLRPLDALKAWMEKRKTLRSLPPVTVGNAEFLQNTLAGSDIDIARFPAPTWHRHDGGPFIGSGSVVVMRDPDTGWLNASIYRVQVHGPNKVTVQFDHGGRHGAIIARKYWDRGESCPVAVVHGEDPALFIAGFEYLPDGSSEYGFAGAIKGAPIEVVRRAANRAAAPGSCGDSIRRSAVADARRDLAGRPVRRVHRLLRRRGASRSGDAGDGDPLSQRSDPPRVAANEAAALSFRPAVPRRDDLEQSRSGRRYRRRRRVAARFATHDSGGAAPALRRTRQARRRWSRRRTATWRASSSWSTRTSIRPISPT